LKALVSGGQFWGIVKVNIESKALRFAFET